MASAICPKCDPCGLMKSSRAVRCRFPPLLMSSPRLSPPKRSPPPRGNADPDAVTADMLKSLERFMVGLCWINVSYHILSILIPISEVLQSSTPKCPQAQKLNIHCSSKFE